MERDVFSIKETRLSYGRGYAYSLQYHLVWCTKYRKKVDHIHLLVDCRPQFFISDMIKIMKGNLARQMFLVHPELKQELWGGHLWNPSQTVQPIFNFIEKTFFFHSLFRLHIPGQHIIHQTAKASENIANLR